MTSNGQALYRRAKQLIPGGTQLLSKRPELFLPERWPAYYSRARGCEVWDLDDRVYIDMATTAIGACALGYADPEVNEAARAAVDSGSMCTLNAPEEVTLAERLCELHPWADRVRYARTGGEAMAIAVRIARAATGRETVAFCGYHGWHDWYLAANLGEGRELDGHLLPGLDPAGVPRGLRGTAIPFDYNDTSALDRAVTEAGESLAAIVMEPIRDREPAPGFLEHVRNVANERGCVLIIDEITAAFRRNIGGAHKTMGVTPDIAVFAKALSNGFPMAAIIGRASVMEAAQSTFISSTYWTERIGPAAALATIDKMINVNCPEHLCTIGNAVRTGWHDAAAASDLAIKTSGIEAMPKFDFLDGDPAYERSTLFTQLMLERGFLAGKAFYATFAHREEHIGRYLEAVGESFAIISRAAVDGTISDLLEGPPQKPGFRRLT